MQDVFIDGRIALKPMPVYQGRRASVKYKGLLAQSGAQKVYMHVGYGQDWGKGTDVPMSYVGGQCWQSDMTIDGTDRLNFCFRDNGGNWDNNWGMNWSVEIL